MAGEPTPKVLAVFCSMLWKEGPRLLGGQGGDAEATDLRGAGRSLQVWTRRKTLLSPTCTFNLLKQGGRCSQHPISYLGLASSGFPSFLLFRRFHNSDLQAFTVQLLEENLGSTYGNLSVAPAPRDILWQNMKSPTYLWSYILFFVAILIAFSCVALSPVIFAKNIQEKVFDILHIGEGTCQILGMLLNSVLFFTFTQLTPYFVKVFLKRTQKSFPPS